MVRKVMALLICVLALTSAVCGSVQAATYTPYENSEISSTKLAYFRDLLGKLKFGDDYALFRGDRDTYVMAVGDLSYLEDDDYHENLINAIVGKGEVKLYTIFNTGEQNMYACIVEDEFVLHNPNVSMIYSNLGDFPELETRGDKYAIFTAVLLCIALLCIVINRIFFRR